jgi:thiamine biosynthesis lipoprotein
VPDQHRVEEVMGTVVSVDVRGASGPLDEMFEWLHRVDATFSTYKPDSEISRLARNEISLSDCSEDVALILEMCEALKNATNGYFDAWASGTLDPSGLVKGWSVERASQMLYDAGCTRHCINAGGDVRVRDDTWRVGVVHPFDRKTLTIVVEGTDIAVATSGSAERGDHVYDPHTQAPATELASVTIVGPDLTYADAYATAAFAMGLSCRDWLPALRGHEAYVIDASGYAWWTEGMTAYAPSLDRA